MVRAVSLKALKNKLSEYVRLVARGETVLVIDRNRIVAEIVPPRGDRATVFADTQLADAVRNGWLRPPVLPSDAIPSRRPVATLRELLSELAADRSDR